MKTAKLIILIQFQTIFFHGTRRRAAAVNSLEDIAALVEHAHLYNARIYVTVNTILKEEELKETERMIYVSQRSRNRSQHII